MSFKQELVDFYSKHNPAKLKDVDILLEAFAGREAAMLAALREKYGEDRRAIAAKAEASVTPAVYRECDVGTIQHESRTARMHKLLADMSSVDLKQLVARLDALVEGYGTDTLEVVGMPSGRHRTLPLLKHTVTFMQFFSDCAEEFLKLATEAEAEAQLQSETYPPSATVPEAASRTRASVSPSPPSVARTDTHSATSGSPRLLSPASPPPLSSPSPSYHQRHPPQPRVVALAPPPRQSPSALTSAAANASDGLTLELQPGTYTECAVFTDCGSVTVTAAYPGAPVVLRPAVAGEPALRVHGPDAKLTVRGAVFVSGDVPPEAVAAEAAPASVRSQGSGRCNATTALVMAAGGAALHLEGCHVYSGALGGVVALGNGTAVGLELCLVALCGFAGVAVREGATATVERCRVKTSECGVRASGVGSTLRLRDSTVMGSAVDGIVVHEGAIAVVERTSVANNAGNGVFADCGSEVRILESTVELNGMYGIHRSRGSRLHLMRSFVRDNGLLPVSESRA